MSDTLPELEDEDFRAEMEKLVAQAAGDANPAGSGGNGQDGTEVKDPAPFLAEKMAGMEKKIEMLTDAVSSLGRSGVRQAQVIEGLEAFIKKLEPLLKSSPEHAAPLRGNKGSVDERMFSALHEELRTYKDEFLANLLQKPAVSGMITLHDDLREIARQVKGITHAGQEAGPEESPRKLSHVATNLDHVIHSLLEVMSRVGVEPLETESGKLDRKKQKAVHVEPAETADEDGDIVKKLRRGFTWRGRIFRPEEVVVRKFKGGATQTGAD